MPYHFVEASDAQRLQELVGAAAALSNRQFIPLIFSTSLWSVAHVH
ncbi:hypothetical protein [uncultured Nostoc sp.]